MPSDFEGSARQVHADGSGYVQRISVDALMRIATKHDLVVRIEARPGRFVSKGDAMLAAYPRDRVSDEIANDLGARSSWVWIARPSRISNSQSGASLS
jgi:uncharacterized membrane protein